MRAGHVVPVLATAVLAGGLVGCGGDDSPSGGPSGKAADTVVIKTFAFTPKRVTVDAGTTVTFRNDDAILHTVTSGTRRGESDDTPDGRFDIDLPQAGATGTETFDEPGTYAYFCKVHPGPGMTGEVVVK